MANQHPILPTDDDDAAEEAYPQPWLEEVRAKIARETEGMSPEEVAAYFKNELARMRAERQAAAESGQ